MGAWVPLQSDEEQWLQVDFGKVVEITKICTQGGGDGVEHCVKTYIILFSQDGENFQEYQENNDSKVRNNLQLSFFHCDVNLELLMFPDVSV